MAEGFASLQMDNENKLIKKKQEAINSLSKLKLEIKKTVSYEEPSTEESRTPTLDSEDYKDLEKEKNKLLIENEILRKRLDTLKFTEKEMLKNLKFFRKKREEDPNFFNDFFDRFSRSLYEPKKSPVFHGSSFIEIGDKSRTWKKMFNSFRGSPTKTSEATSPESSIISPNDTQSVFKFVDTEQNHIPKLVVKKPENVLKVTQLENPKVTKVTQLKEMSGIRSNRTSINIINSVVEQSKFTTL
jgi:hypothetical protein